MAEHQYVLSQAADAPERERLALLERNLDPLSQRRLAALGIEPGWRCLEVGAGHGSIVRWLAAQVGPQGRVVATDINPRFLTEIGNEGASRIVQGGEAEARLMYMTLPAFVERGILSPAEYAEHQQVLLDPSFSFITRTTFAAWGKRNG